MAVYKVPQDVEADDKLIGPFSFRQFIYLIVAVIAMGGAWGLGTSVFPALAVLPLPIILFFGALAFPRKDQPMETYLSAIVSFYFLKPRRRFWQPDGIDSFITIIPPKDADKILTKDLDEEEATKRLNYLADLVDTHGWAIRGAGTAPDTSMNTDLYYESQQTPDMMDSTTPAAQAMTQQLNDQVDQQKQDAIALMQNAAKQAQTASAQTPVAPAEPVSTLPSIDEVRARQSTTIQKIADKDARDALAYVNALTEEATSQRVGGMPAPAQRPATIAAAPKPAVPPQNQPVATSVSTPAAGTIELTKQQADNLAGQTDVSVQTLAHEANRVAQQNKALKNGDEITISFR